MYRGIAYTRLGRNAPALESFDAALRLNPDLVEAYFHRGSIRALLNNAALAREDLERVVARVPKHLRAQYALAGIDQADGKYESAIKRYDLILEQKPNNAVMLNNRCYVKALLGRSSEAVRDCDKSLEQRPGDPIILDSRAFALLRGGEYRRAIADYDVVVKAQPRNAIALYGRGYAHRRLGESKKSEIDVGAAKLIDPNVADKMSKLGLPPLDQN